MDGVTLLAAGRAAGLTIRHDGVRLVVEGPRRLEALARLVIEHKHDVVAALEPANVVERALAMFDGERTDRSDLRRVEPRRDHHAGELTLGRALAKLGAIDARVIDTTARPSAPCYACGGTEWSRLQEPGCCWICVRCSPPGDGTGPRDVYRLADRADP